MALILCATPLLGGCALQAAMLAHDISDEIRPALGPSNAHLKPTATEACTQRAGQYGSVYVADVEQRRSDRIIVWGSVTDPQRRRTFECHYTTALSSFTLREIAPAR
ncbi:MAG: hypothetical protein H0V46_05555 [Sphingomonas sp.]|nr:hypothetical protein [Sphingomonas sp.]